MAQFIILKHKKFIYDVQNTILLPKEKLENLKLTVPVPKHAIF